MSKAPRATFVLLKQRNKERDREGEREEIKFCWGLCCNTGERWSSMLWRQQQQAASVSAADDGAFEIHQKRTGKLFWCLYITDGGGAEWGQSVCQRQHDEVTTDRFPAQHHLGHHQHKVASCCCTALAVCCIHMCIYYFVVAQEEWCCYKSGRFMCVFDIMFLLTCNATRRSKTSSMCWTKQNKKKMHLFLVSLDGFWTSVISSSVLYGLSPLILYFEIASSFGRWFPRNL